MESDFALARALQAQFDEEDAHEEVSNFIPEEFRLGSPAKKIRAIDGPPETSIIAPEWEDLDPTPGKTKLSKKIRRDPSTDNGYSRYGNSSGWGMGGPVIWSKH